MLGCETVTEMLAHLCGRSSRSSGLLLLGQHPGAGDECDERDEK